MDDLKQSYYNVFLATAEGRRVLNDMRNRAYARFRDKVTGDCSNPAAQLALDDFIAGIMKLCGIDSDKAELDLLTKAADVAANNLIEQKKQDEEKPVIDD